MKIVELPKRDARMLKVISDRVDKMAISPIQNQYIAELYWKYKINTVDLYKLFAPAYINEICNTYGKEHINGKL